MRDRLRRPVGDDGVVAVMVAVFAVVLVAFLAFAADLGNAYATKRVLSTAADGAALAAAQELAGQGLLCAVPAPAVLTAKDVARDYSSVRNAPGSVLRLGVDGFNLGCAPDGAGLVTVGNSKKVPFVFGVGAVTPEGDATAKYGAASTVTGLRPIGLCNKTSDYAELLVQAALPQHGKAVRFLVDKTKETGNPKATPTAVLSGACGGASGNWGLLDLDEKSDGSNVNVKGEGPANGTPDLRTWLSLGFSGELDLEGKIIFGNPGSPGGGKLADEAQSIIGKTIILPVYDQIVPGTQGANAQFKVVSFVSVMFCDYKFGNKKGAPKAPCASKVSSQPNDPDYIELLFEESLTIGKFKNCVVAPLSCTTSGAYTIALVK